MKTFFSIFGFLGALVATSVHAARCNERDLMGRWAFFSHGVASDGTSALPVGSVGSVRLDGRGRVVDGWVATRTGFDPVTVIDGVSGSYTVEDYCMVTVEMTAANVTRTFTGALAKGKQFIQSYSNSDDGQTVAAYHARVTGQCRFNESTITGSFIGADLRMSEGGTEEGFLETLDCKSDNSCRLLTSTSGSITTGNTTTGGWTPVNITASDEYACLFSFGPTGSDRVAVSHENGLYVISNDTQSFTTGYLAGAM